MITTSLRQAVNISKVPLKKVAEQLLPSLALYRRLLRVHRKALPIEMRVMGDEYVKAEFRRTRSTDNPLHIVGFLGEWKKYLDFHETQVAEMSTRSTTTTTTTTTSESVIQERKREGQKLQDDLFEKLSADQLGQLYELLQATKEVWTDPSAPTKIDGVTTTTTAPGDEIIAGIPKGQILPDLATKRKVE